MLTLLAQPNPSVDLIVAFADWERRTQDQRERVHELLQDAFQRAPDDLRVVSHLTHFDMEAEKPDLALARLDREIARRGDQAGLLLLRARVQTGLGSLGLAQADARRAFDLDPRLPGALQLLVSLYASRGQVAEAIASFEQIRTEMK